MSHLGTKKISVYLLVFVLDMCVPNAEGYFTFHYTQFQAGEKLYVPHIIIRQLGLRLRRRVNLGSVKIRNESRKNQT
jgi:hypothetical protein